MNHKSGNQGERNKNIWYRMDWTYVVKHGKIKNMIHEYKYH